VVDTAGIKIGLTGTGHVVSRLWSEYEITWGWCMNESSFEEKLNELLNTAGDVPSPQRDKILFMARKNNEHYKVLQEKISTLQNSLDYLRLGVKYMIFDLEATRRENLALRKQVEQLRGPSDTPNEGTGGSGE
jgi:hypothetical protein